MVPRGRNNVYLLRVIAAENASPATVFAGEKIGLSAENTHLGTYLFEFQELRLVRPQSKKQAKQSR